MKLIDSLWPVCSVNSAPRYLDLAIHGEAGRQHDAEFGNAVDVRDLLEGVLETERLRRRLRVIRQHLALGAPAPKNLYVFHMNIPLN